MGANSSRSTHAAPAPAPAALSEDLTTAVAQANQMIGNFFLAIQQQQFDPADFNTNVLPKISEVAKQLVSEQNRHPRDNFLAAAQTFGDFPLVAAAAHGNIALFESLLQQYTAPIALTNPSNSAVMKAISFAALNNMYWLIGYVLTQDTPFDKSEVMQLIIPMAVLGNSLEVLRTFVYTIIAEPTLFYLPNIQEVVGRALVNAVATNNTAMIVVLRYELLSNSTIIANHGDLTRELISSFSAARTLLEPSTSLQDIEEALETLGMGDDMTLRTIFSLPDQIPDFVEGVYAEVAEASRSTPAPMAPHPAGDGKPSISYP